MACPHTASNRLSACKTTWIGVWDEESIEFTGMMDQLKWIWESLFFNLHLIHIRCVHVQRVVGSHPSKSKISGNNGVSRKRGLEELYNQTMTK